MDIRIHGRGGQGTVTLAALLVDTAFESGYHVLGFPAFGTERTGAPVAAFVKLSAEPIRDRGEVKRPDVVIVQDPTLIGNVDVLDGLSSGGVVLINGARVPDPLSTVDARALPVTELALRYLGDAKTSTAMLAFFAGATKVVLLEAVIAAIHRRFSGAVAERNEELARAAFAAAVSDGRSAA